MKLSVCSAVDVLRWVSSSARTAPLGVIRSRDFIGIGIWNESDCYLYARTIVQPIFWLSGERAEKPLTNSVCLREQPSR